MKDQGLRFECVPGCTACCAIPGHVFVHESEIREMANYFSMTVEDFTQARLRHYNGDVYMFNFPDYLPCIYLTETGCSIYQVRPIQCRTYPFWPENLSNAFVWKNQKKMCPGIDNGRMYTIDEITDIAAEAAKISFL